MLGLVGETAGGGGGNPEEKQSESDESNKCVFVAGGCGCG